MNDGFNWRLLSNYLVDIWEKRKHSVQIMLCRSNVNAFDLTFLL